MFALQIGMFVALHDRVVRLVIRSSDEPEHLSFVFLAQFVLQLEANILAAGNLMGRGQLAKASVTYGERVRGFELSFVEPYFLGYRMAAGIDLFARKNLASRNT